jgi:anti-anti-sigma factor
MTTEALDEVVVLRPEGGLCEGEECDEMERRLHDLLGRGRRVIVDLSSTRMLTAHGLGVLARAQQVAAQHGGRLAICGAAGLERWVLDLTHLAQVVPVFASAEEAARSLGGSRAVA